MDTDQIRTKMNQADQFLEAAQNEMFRSEEDVVPHMACSCARQSIQNYLQGFLLKHKIEQKEAVSLQTLLEKCQQIDPNFKSFDLSKMACRTETHDDNFCTDLNTVEYCVDLAVHAKKLVTESKIKASHWPESRPIK